MAKSERIEDLGKLSILLKELFRDELFADRYWYRPKDAWETFSSLSDGKKEECIRHIAYGLERISENISDCCSIANGETDE